MRQLSTKVQMKVKHDDRTTLHRGGSRGGPGGPGPPFRGKNLVDYIGNH